MKTQRSQVALDVQSCCSKNKTLLFIPYVNCFILGFFFICSSYGKVSLMAEVHRVLKICGDEDMMMPICVHLDDPMNVHEQGTLLSQSLEMKPPSGILIIIFHWTR